MSASSGTGAGSPQACYQRDLDSGLITPDPAQAATVAVLQQMFEALAATPEAREPGLFGRLTGRRSPRWEPVRGLYLWGRVGRGKTYLVDTFFDCLPQAGKKRIHFHSFMRQTHDALKGLADTVSPLNTIAADWAQEYRVIGLDEFHVGDITDAMLLANLIEALLADGVTLIATSNERPDELYAGGLQRERFLPAIALIESELEVMELWGEEDFRLRTLEQAPVYYIGVPGSQDAALDARFAAMAPGTTAGADAIRIEGRDIATRRRTDGVVWFDFEALCGGPRASADYIELARLHHTIVVGDIPVFGRDDNDAARRFINFIDEAYDRNVNLIVSAAAEPEALYAGGRLDKPFLRTASRLREMRSHEYLALPHGSD